MIDFPIKLSISHAIPKMTKKHFENANFNLTELHIPYKLHNTPWGQHQDVTMYITPK